MAALPKDIQEQLQALGKGEADDPTPSGQPNIFRSDGRDAVSKVTEHSASISSRDIDLSAIFSCSHAGSLTLTRVTDVTL